MACDDIILYAPTILAKTLLKTLVSIIVIININIYNMRLFYELYLIR